MLSIVCYFYTLPTAVQIEGANLVYKVLQLHIFNLLPDSYKNCILDCLYFILRKNIYEIVRFRCCREDSVLRNGSSGIVHLLLASAAEIIVDD